MNQNAEDDLLSGFGNAIVEYVKKKMDNCLPCIVTEVNATRTKVSVVPLLQKTFRDKSQIERPEIAGLTVFTGGAGGIIISFPIKVGDLGWIEATDRDISLFLQSYDSQAAPTERKHSFSDARFIPDIMRGFTINAEDENAIVVQNLDGSVKVALDDNQIRIQNNDARIEMDADQITVTTSTVSIVIDGSSVTGTAPDGFNLNGFTIDATGAALSPVSLTAPNVIAGTSITKAGVEVADGEHTHNAGTYEVGGDPVTGTSAQSNG